MLAGFYPPYCSPSAGAYCLPLCCFLEAELLPTPVFLPYIIAGAMEDWPALARWCDPAYLIAVAGPRTVPVEVS